MPDAPAISIVMPLYNKAAHVVATIASVTAQTIRDWEMVVVDDGSTDNGSALVLALGDERIRVISQTNAGVSAARNRGIQLARSELIAFLDADDLWSPQFLATILALQSDFPNARWFATGYEIRPEQGVAYASRLRCEATAFSARGILPDYFEVAAVSDPPAWTSATAVHRDAIRAIGGFPSGISSGEDLLTWARLAVRFSLAYDARPMATYKVSGTQRRADRDDLVGKALRQLIAEYPAVPSLRAYIGLWYRIQSVLALPFGDKKLARRYAWLATRHGPRQMPNIYTLLLAWLPVFCQGPLDAMARHLHKKWQRSASL